MNKYLRRLLFAGLLAFSSTLLLAQLPPPCPNGVEPAEDCESTCTSCDFNGYVGTTANWAAGSVPSFCSMIQNDQWIGFIAGANNATFTVTPSNCTGGNGVQVALYGGCGENFISCNGGNAGNGNVPTVITAPLTPGTNYYLLIDGYSGDQCDFTVTVNPPTAVQAQPLGPLGNIYGPATVCPGATATYAIPSVTNAGGYTWTVPPGATVNGLPSGTTLDAPGGRIVEIIFGATGGQICVQAGNSCFQGSIACKNVQIVPIPPTILPKVTFCSNAPYTLPWGTPVSVSGTYSNTYQSYQGCDSVVRQQVVIKPPIITNLAPRVICAGSCVTVCGQNFCQSGSVSKICPSFQGCDSVVNFQLTVLHPIAEILGGSLLSCANDSVILTSAPSGLPGLKTWRKLDGTMLATNTNSLVVVQPDTIILTTTQQQGGVFCSNSDTVIITANFSIPTATAAVDSMLACHRPTVQLAGGTDTPGASFMWSGPNSFLSTAISPVAYAAGPYTLLVTNPLSHCTATATVAVLADGDLPIITATGGSLTCLIDSLTLLTATTATAPSFSWAGPGGFSSNLANPKVAVAGTYIVTVMDDSTSCLAIAIAKVLDRTAPPMVVATGDTLTCTQFSGTLQVSTTASAPTFMWTGPNGFTSNVMNPVIMQPGIYTVKVTDGSTGCTATTTAILFTDLFFPEAIAVGGILGCQGLPVVLQGSSSTPNVTFAWTGPGFFSNLPNPTVTVPGTYELLVTAPNGCISQATAVVMQLQIPVITNVQITNDQNSQGVGAISIEITGTTSYFVRWYLNGQIYANAQNLIDLSAGQYVGIVITVDGCSDTLSVTVDNLVAATEPDRAYLWEVVPNPASSFLDVHFRGDALPDARLALFDMLGRKVLAGKMTGGRSVRLEVRDLPAGQYQLMIQDEGRTVLRPVVIQR